MTEKAKPVRAWAPVNNDGRMMADYVTSDMPEFDDSWPRIARVEIREIGPPPEVHVRQSADKSDRWTVVRSDMGGFVAEFWEWFGATREDAERFAEELRNRLENEDDQG